MTNRIVNFFAGPGTGKSMTAAALFAELKYQGYNTEYIPEFAKDAAWEGRGSKFFSAQSYIYGCQSYRVDSVIDEVDFAITDSPILQSIVYIPEHFNKPSLRAAIREHHESVESINILLMRTMPYSPQGRYQTANEAEEVSQRIHDLLVNEKVEFTELFTTRNTPFEVIEIMKSKNWI